MPFDAIFQPLKFRNLTVKNRIFRSNISGRFDNYDGSGNQARINWEVKFARGGVGAIISSFVPVSCAAGSCRTTPPSTDDRIPFWRRLARRSTSTTASSSCSSATAGASGTSRDRVSDGPELDRQAGSAPRASSASG